MFHRLLPRAQSFLTRPLSLRWASAINHAPVNKLETILYDLQTQPEKLPQFYEALMAPGVDLFIPQSRPIEPENRTPEGVNLRLLGVTYEGKPFAVVYTSEEILQAATDKAFFIMPPRVLFKQAQQKNFLLNPNSAFWRAVTEEEVGMLMSRPVLSLSDRLKQYFKKKAPSVERAWLRAQKDSSLVLVEAPLEAWPAIVEGAKAEAGNNVKFIRVSTADQDYFTTNPPFYTR